MHINDRTMLAEAMQAMASVMSPAQGSQDSDRGYATTEALEQYERAMSLIRSATGQTLTPGAALKWLREVGRPDLFNMLCNATGQRNGLAHPTDLKMIRDFAAAWADSSCILEETLGADLPKRTPGLSFFSPARLDYYSAASSRGARCERGRILGRDTFLAERGARS